MAAKEGIVISYLPFTNNSLLFSNTNYDQLLYLNWILLSFELASRLKFNLEKNKSIQQAEWTI